MSRPDSVISFAMQPEPGVLRAFMDMFSSLFGKVVSLGVVAMLLEIGGHTVTNAASGAGTALTKTRTTVDFQDAGVDSVRLLVRGENSAVGIATVHLYNVTTSASMANAVITNAVEQTADSGWQVFAPAGGDEEIEIRVIGNDVLDPILYGVHMQMRTVQARS